MKGNIGSGGASRFHSHLGKACVILICVVHFCFGCSEVTGNVVPCTACAAYLCVCWDQPSQLSEAVVIIVLETQA
jgi:hypothetical protein